MSEVQRRALDVAAGALVDATTRAGSAADDVASVADTAVGRTASQVDTAFGADLEAKLAEEVVGQADLIAKIPLPLKSSANKISPGDLDILATHGISHPVVDRADEAQRIVEAIGEQPAPLPLVIHADRSKPELLERFRGLADENAQYLPGPGGRPIFITIVTDPLTGQSVAREVPRNTPAEFLPGTQPEYVPGTSPEYLPVKPEAAHDITVDLYPENGFRHDGFIPSDTL